MTALDVLRESKRRNLLVPLLVVTGTDDEQSAVTALHLGAYDYIVKRNNYLIQLPYAIENVISRSQLLETNKRLQIELEARTRTDERIRQLNTDLEHRLVRLTRDLEAANEELEDTAILELIAQNAPVTEICAQLAALLARRTGAIVSVTAFPPSIR